MRRRLAPGRAALAVLLVVALGVVAVGGLLWWRGGDESRLAHAVHLAPAGTERASWTDWSAVRREVGADLGDTPDGEAVAAFLDEAFTSDLTSTSALVGSSRTLQDEFGFSPATLEWELFVQSSDGAVDILGMRDEDAVDALAGRLRDLGFEEPEDDDGVWGGGQDLLPRIGPDLTPELQYVALLADEGLVLTSDQVAPLEAAVEAARGDADTLSSVDDVVAASGEPLAASVFTGGYACRNLAMAAADADDQEVADALVERAGEVHPMTGFAMGLRAGGDLRVAMSFEDDDVARADAQSRATLASGPAPGQGGDFADRFTLEEAASTGRVVTLDLVPEPGQYVLSDLSSGPVLFATC
ncbi:hypothetical protein [Nocardioides sp. Soil805]|uniref:hypothetical protein n=1 Tax=Nocardioides sp. Soil805 TaxID=1736416 RepID=UPI0007032EA2|nr:hypothetical protein [Nocardioides sp. Soil805]KRF35009.1 hypothetical protein ASG94_12815 [Nocardioides sp. Soil805]